MNKTACLLATKSKSYGSMNMQVNMHKKFNKKNIKSFCRFK